MNTNEELKTRPEFEKLAKEIDDQIGCSILSMSISRSELIKKGMSEIWTTHVEPLQAKLDKSESENQNLREQLKEARDQIDTQIVFFPVPIPVDVENENIDKTNP